MTGTTSDGATSLRRAGPADAAEIAGLLIRARARAAAAGSIPAAVHPDAEVRAWVAAVVVPEREVWLCVSGPGTVVGVMVLDGGWLDQLYVDPDRTGRGIGGRLVEHAKRCRPHGLQLWTFVTNVRAQRFYERHGFAVVEATDGSGNEEKERDLRLAWPAPSRGARGTSR